MLDKEININNSSKTTINSYPAGLMVRSNDNSFFKNFHYNSKYAECVLGHEPMLRIDNYDKKVKILQMMLVGDGYIMAEIIFVEPVGK